MEIAILGLAQSGKSTLFQIMTGVNSRDIYNEKCVRGIAKIPDDRFNQLVEIFKPAKITPASIPFIDINSQGGDEWAAIAQSVGGADGLLHVVDAFTTDDLQKIVEQYKKLEAELIFSDLVIIEKKVGRLAKLPEKSLKGDELVQHKILPNLKEHLETGRPLRELKFSNDEINAIKSFSFWSLKPELVVLNTTEDAKGIVDKFCDLAQTKSKVISICCKIELEIAELPPAEQRDFLDSLGIKTAAFQHIIQEAFSQLDRIYYFTVGEDEVRAWVISRGDKAPKAAAVIHKDFERGFIKAEVVSYDDFMSTGKNLVEAKKAGKIRLEGKEYVVQDGDIISFRFNV